MPEETRLGRQTPTRSLVLPYTETKGSEAVEIYQKSGRTPQEWQQLLLYDILAMNEDRLWTHAKFGYSVPRRNGKNEILAMREMYGLMRGEKILHTAHRTTTSHNAWERLCGLLDSAGIEYASIRAIGMEKIRIAETSGGADFRTRSTKGGLGEGFDLLIIDEAQEYTEDQDNALKYVVSDSKNPQTILCGTPPTPVSSGTVFMKLRLAALAGETRDTGWAEWSVDSQHDPQDTDAWYETNPSMGTILTERKVADEIGRDVVDFNIQRLGLWLRYNQKSAISKVEWDALKAPALPELCGKLFAGVKYGQTNVCLSIAAHTTDGRVFLETIDCRKVRDGPDWMVAFLKAADVAGIAIDGANGQKLLADAMKDARVRPTPILPTVKQAVTAYAKFEQAVFQKQLCHMGQPALAQAAGNCEHRAIGTGGGFGYRALREEIEIGLLESAAFAVWGCLEMKEGKQQRISY